MYTVSEYEGMVEVCTVVFFLSGNCPIQFPFNISFQTSDGTAGKTFGIIVHTWFDIHVVMVLLYILV